MHQRLTRVHWNCLMVHWRLARAVLEGILCIYISHITSYVLSLSHTHDSPIAPENEINNLATVSGSQ